MEWWWKLPKQDCCKRCGGCELSKDKMGIEAKPTFWCTKWKVILTAVGSPVMNSDHRHRGRLTGHNMFIQLLESPIPTSTPPPTPTLSHKLRMGYFGNGKSYQRSAGGKTTGLLVTFQSFEKTSVSCTAFVPEVTFFLWGYFCGKWEGWKEIITIMRSNFFAAAVVQF